MRRGTSAKNKKKIFGAVKSQIDQNITGFSKKEKVLIGFSASNYETLFFFSTEIKVLFLKP